MPSPHALLSLHRNPARVAITVGAAILVGTQLGVVTATTDPARLLMICPVLLVIGIMFKVHPRWTVVAILGGSLMGFYSMSVAFGPIDLRATDVPYSALVLWVFVLKSRGRAVRTANIGQPQIGIVLVILVVTLVPVLRSMPSDFLGGFVSWLRLAQTFSLLWLVPYAIDDDDDRRFLLHALCVVGVLEILMALQEFWTQVGWFNLGSRLDGPIGPNATGLVGGLMLAFALHSPFTSRRAKFVIGAFGFVALLMSQSVGGMAAVALTLAMFGLRRARRQDRRRDALVRPARLFLLVFGLIAIVAALRPSNLPTNEKFLQSTSAHRAVLGLAGIELFRSNPWMGVGWQRSSLQHVVGAPEIVDRLRERFEGAPEDFFPDLYANSVHNVYIQIAAESGLLGLFALAMAAIALRHGVVRLLAAPEVDTATVRLVVVLLVVVFVWWNDNALFGAQPETIAAGVLLGVLASFGRVSTFARPIVVPEVAAQPAPVGASPEPVTGS